MKKHFGFQLVTSRNFSAVENMLNMLASSCVSTGAISGVLVSNSFCLSVVFVSDQLRWNSNVTDGSTRRQLLCPSAKIPIPPKAGSATASTQTGRSCLSYRRAAGPSIHTVSRTVDTLCIMYDICTDD